MLLAALLLEPGRAVPTDRLIRLLWDAEPPERARSGLHTHISRLRRALSGDDDSAMVERCGDGYAILVDPASVDAHRYRRLVERALAVDDLAERARMLRESEALWRGRPLSDLAGQPAWAELSARLEDLHRSAVKERFAAELAVGRHEEVAGALAEVVGQAPVDESMVSLLMRALYRCGRRGEALEVYRRTRRRLAAELGLEPCDDLQRLHQAMLRGDPGLAADRTAAGPTPRAPATPDPASASEAPTTSGTAAAPSAPPAPQQLPAVLADFVGRAADLAEIRRVAVPGPGVVVIAIAGLPGVGKTSLAIKAAHELRSRSPGPALHLDLGGEAGPVPPEEALARLLRALGVPGSRIPEDLSERAGLVRASLAGRPCLLVLDDAANAAQVAPLIPSDRAVVLVTSRRTLADLDGAHHLHLRQLAPHEAVALLGKVIGEQRVAGDPASAAELVDYCDRLPLAVRIVAARLMSRPHWSLRHAAGRLAELTTRLDHLTRSHRSVRAAFDSTYGSLPDPARRLLRGLALHDLVDVPAWLGAVILDADAATGEEAWATLVEANLLEVGGPDVAGQYRHRMHDLVRAFAHERALAEEPAEERRATLARTFAAWLAISDRADAVLGDFPYRPHPGIAPDITRRIPDADLPPADVHAWFRAEMPNLRLLIAQARRTPQLRPHAWALAWNSDYFLRIDGRYDELGDCCRDGLAAAEEAGDDHGVACMHLCLSFIDLQRTTMVGALRHLEAAGAAAARTTDRWLQGEITVILAGVHDSTGDLDAERAALTRAVELFTEIGDPVSGGGSLAQLARVGALQGDPAAMESAMRGVALLREWGAGRQLALGLMRLGLVHTQLGHHEEARDAYQEGLELVQRHRDRVGQLSLHAHLSTALTGTGRLSEAARHLAAAAALADEIDLPRYHAYVLHARGRLQRARGELAAARDTLRECLDRDPHPALRLSALSDLARVCRVMGEHDAARHHFAQALDTATRLGATVDARRIREELAPAASAG
jgi:DNA-binding SARP family transcriptional activator/Flp pilus assembly protein TadD